MTDFFLVVWDKLGSDTGKTITLILFVVGLVISFFLGLWRNRYEVQSLKSQIVSNVASVLLDMQRARHTYDECSARCGRLAHDLREHIGKKSSRQEIDDVRETLCACLLNETIPAFLSDVEWQHVDRQAKGDPDELMVVVSDAAEELRRFRSWVDVINHPVLLEHLQRRPAKIQRRSLRPFSRVVEKFPPTIRNNAARVSNEVINELLA